MMKDGLRGEPGYTGPCFCAGSDEGVSRMALADVLRQDASRRHMSQSPQQCSEWTVVVGLEWLR